MKLSGANLLQRTEILVVNSPRAQVIVAAEKLLKILKPVQGSISDPLVPLIPGKVWNNGFELVFRRSFPQHFAPYIRASFNDCSTGTLIMLTYQLQPMTSFFTFISFIIGVFTISVFMAVAFQFLLATVVGLSLVLIYTFIVFHFRQLCQEASTIISHHFNHLSESYE